tara:strand:+ start:4434 stop:4901 length:468 start_codon:yes stop_codon:yes gene_type:complete
MENEIDHFVDNEYEQIYIVDNEIYLNNPTDTLNTDILPDQWISDNQDEIYTIYQDLLHKSPLYDNLLNKLSFPSLCDYYNYALNDNSVDTINWNDIYDIEIPARNIKFCRTFKEWAAYYVYHMYDLYNYLRNVYNFKLTSFEIFMDFCYDNTFPS